MVTSVLGDTIALLAAISLLCPGSHGDLLPNCRPTDGIIKNYEDKIYIQPDIDQTPVALYLGTGNLYKKTFTFTSPCNLLLKAVSLMYTGSCSVTVSYGSDNRLLETLHFPVPLSSTWHTGFENLNQAATQTLNEYMTRNEITKLMITISARDSRCNIYKVQRTSRIIRGLAIIAQVSRPPAATSPAPNRTVTARSVPSRSTQQPTASTATAPVTTASTVPTPVTNTAIVESTRTAGASVTQIKKSTPATTLVEHLDDKQRGFSLVTTIVIPLVVLSVLLSVFILLLLVRSRTFLSGSSHPWIIAIRKSTVPQNRPDPINQFYENHNGPDGADRGPTAELTDPGLYSAVGPGYSHPTNRPKTPPDIAAALYDSCTENETYTYATRDDAAPTCFVNTETKQKDAGEPYASVQSMFDQSIEDVHSQPKSQETETARQEAEEAPAVCYSVPHKTDTTDVRRRYENAEECTATKRDEQPRTTHSIDHICHATDVTSRSVLSRSAQSAVHNQEKCINPDDVERKQRRGLSDATPVVCRNPASTTTSTNQQYSRLSFPATSTSTPTGSDTQRCGSPSQVPKPLPYRVFKVLKDSQGDYMNPQDTVSSQGADQLETDTDPNIYAEPAISLSDDILCNATTLQRRDEVGGISTVPVDLPDPSAIYAVPQKGCAEP
ncbi:mucin-5AC-like isoform X1 [Sycon ciliatum]|uniref:mucin-5AC-like isoform X1 n=1 Tax=Sycon ciliatum TaxID=27933 RepID=UPI0031F6062A